MDVSFTALRGARRVSALSVIELNRQQRTKQRTLSEPILQLGNGLAQSADMGIDLQGLGVAEQGIGKSALLGMAMAHP